MSVFGLLLLLSLLLFAFALGWGARGLFERRKETSHGGPREKQHDDHPGDWLRAQRKQGRATQSGTFICGEFCEGGPGSLEGGGVDLSSGDNIFFFGISFLLSCNLIIFRFNIISLLQSSIYSI